MESQQTSEQSRSTEQSKISEMERRLQHQQHVQAQIEKIVLDTIKSVVNGKLPFLEHRRSENSLSLDVKKKKRNWVSPEDIVMCRLSEENEVEIVVEENDVTLPIYKQTRVRFEKKQSRRKFALLLNLMAKIYNMIQKKQTCTKRDLFYENVSLYGNQARLEKALQELCLVLKVPRDALSVVPTSKGLIAGDLIFTDAFGETINVNRHRSGILVPNVIEGIHNLQSNAKFILFVEKDAVFQRLIGEKIFETFGPMILMTGKGYPDIGTRKLVHKLNQELKLRVFMMVDCDPHGIEIAAIVRWGSYGQANLARVTDDKYAKELMVPDMIWIGLLPCEVGSMNLHASTSLPMTVRDLRKLESLETRLLGQHMAQEWYYQIEILKERKVKTELEALFNHGYRFTTLGYLKSKFDAYYKKMESGVVHNMSYC